MKHRRNKQANSSDQMPTAINRGSSTSTPMFTALGHPSPKKKKKRKRKDSDLPFQNSS